MMGLWKAVLGTSSSFRSVVAEASILDPRLPRLMTQETNDRIPCRVYE